MIFSESRVPHPSALSLEVPTEMTSNQSDPNPPWYVPLPGGRGIDWGAIPDRLLRHPELHERGLVPFDTAKPVDIYFLMSIDMPMR